MNFTKFIKVLTVLLYYKISNHSYKKVLEENDFCVLAFYFVFSWFLKETYTYIYCTECRKKRPKGFSEKTEKTAY